MNDMSSVIVPKSDQINADDLIGRDMTITIREVQIKGGQEQPVSIYFDGSDKAFRPCKGMSRVLVAAWGPDANQYIGRSLTLYRDPKVKWGGLEVGGIRISAMSHLDKPMTLALAESRAVRKPVTIGVLKVEAQVDKAAAWAADQVAAVAVCPDPAAYDALVGKGAKAMAKLQTERPELYAQVTAAYAERCSQLAGNEPGATMIDDDPFTDDAPDFLARISSAADPADLGLVEQDYREVMADLPKAQADEIEAALVAKREALAGEG